MKGLRHSHAYSRIFTQNPMIIFKWFRLWSSWINPKSRFHILISFIKGNVFQTNLVLCETITALSAWCLIVPDLTTTERHQAFQMFGNESFTSLRRNLGPIFCSIVLIQSHWRVYEKPTVLQHQRLTGRKNSWFQTINTNCAGPKQKRKAVPDHNPTTAVLFCSLSGILCWFCCQV